MKRSTIIALLIVLWFGGAWLWLDGQTPLEVCGRDNHPVLAVVFFVPAVVIMVVVMALMDNPNNPWLR